jgi:hypothetical protein
MVVELFPRQLAAPPNSCGSSPDPMGVDVECDEAQANIRAD